MHAHGRICRPSDAQLRCWASTVFPVTGRVRKFSKYRAAIYQAKKWNLQNKMHNAYGRYWLMYVCLCTSIDGWMDARKDGEEKKEERGWDGGREGGRERNTHDTQIIWKEHIVVCLSWLALSCKSWLCNTLSQFHHILSLKLHMVKVFIPQKR